MAILNCGQWNKSGDEGSLEVIMQRIVLSYWSGSEWEGTEVTECLHYESAEALYCELEAAIIKYLAERDAHGRYPLGEFEIAGKSFVLSDFLRYDAEIKKPVINMPDIQTLDEWFASKVT